MKFIDEPFHKQLMMVK